MLHKHQPYVLTSKEKNAGSVRGKTLVQDAAQLQDKERTFHEPRQYKWTTRKMREEIGHLKRRWHAIAVQKNMPKAEKPCHHLKDSRTTKYRSGNPKKQRIQRGGSGEKDTIWNWKIAYSATEGIQNKLARGWGAHIAVIYNLPAVIKVEDTNWCQEVLSQRRGNDP